MLPPVSPRLTDYLSDLQVVTFMTDVTVCGLSDEGCCAPQVLSWLPTDFCSACLLWCRLSPSGSRSPSVWGFWSVQDVGMLLEGSKRNRNSFSVSNGGNKKNTTICGTESCSTGYDHEREQNLFNWKVLLSWTGFYYYFCSQNPVLFSWDLYF